MRQNPPDNIDTKALIKVVRGNDLGTWVRRWTGGTRCVGRQRQRCLEKRDTTTGEDTLLNNSTHGIERIVIAVLLLTNLDLTAPTDLDNCNTTAQLGQPLLQIGLVKLARRRVTEKSTDLFTTRLDSVI